MSWSGGESDIRIGGAVVTSTDALAGLRKIRPGDADVTEAELASILNRAYPSERVVDAIDMAVQGFSSVPLNHHEFVSLAKEYQARFPRGSLRIAEELVTSSDRTWFELPRAPGQTYIILDTDDQTYLPDQATAHRVEIIQIAGLVTCVGLVVRDTETHVTYAAHFSSFTSASDALEFWLSDLHRRGAQHLQADVYYAGCTPQTLQKRDDLAARLTAQQVGVSFHPLGFEVNTVFFRPSDGAWHVQGYRQYTEEAWEPVPAFRDPMWLPNRQPCHSGSQREW